MSLERVRHSLAAAAVAVSLAGCASDAMLQPEADISIGASSSAGRSADLGACGDLRAPEGSTLVFHAYARGVQVYRWNGQAWQFTGPLASLFADAGGTGVIGSHYGGPTWEANSGGLVVGAVSKRCDVDPADVPWLLLDVVRNEGPGVFSRVTHIQRINTVGGQIPAGNGSYPGEVRHVPYTAEYFFYR
jgi:hypothetical protein